MPTRQGRQSPVPRNDHLQTLQTRDLDEGKRREFYQIMLEDSDRLLHTIEQVLRAGSTQSQFRRIDQVRLDIADLTKDCVELARTRFHLPQDALTFEPKTTDPAMIVGDPDELKAAIWNLIDNAVKFSLRDGGVTVRLGVLGADVLLEVVDEGIGVPAEEQERLFSRFFRSSLSVADEIQGTGLGLALVQTVVEGHDGAVDVASVEGEGTTVSVRLPRAATTDPTTDPTTGSTTDPAT